MWFNAARPSYAVQPHYSNLGTELNLKFVFFSAGQLTTTMREMPLKSGRYQLCTINCS